nr:squalene/phytoene synthase family protein [Micromonospora sp. DSM 115978]
MRELDAAGIREPRLRQSYARCRQLNAAHGRTYYLATLLLPVWKRPYVHALYGFARYADEIVDDLDSTLSDPEKAAWLRGFGERFLAALRDDLPPRRSKRPPARERQGCPGRRPTRCPCSPRSSTRSGGGRSTSSTSRRS